jgi:hemerythrin
MTHAGSPDLKDHTHHATPADLAIAEIEHEHATLAERLATLREMLSCAPGEGDCDKCSDAEAAACWEQTGQFLADLLGYMQHHIRVEEAAMRWLNATSSEREAAAAHVEAHADMMERAAKLIRLAELQAERVAARDLLEDWLREHIATHDTLLLDRLRRAAKPTT